MGLSLTRVTQFHEQAAVIDWWQERLGPVLRWLTPVRRRTILAIGAVYVGVREPLQAMAQNKALSTPSSALGQAAVIVALFAFLWLCYRAAKSFAALPVVIKRRPQLTLHAIFWLLLAVLWVTVPEDGPWRAVLAGIAVTFPLILWRCGYMLLSGQRNKMGGTRFTDHLIYLWPLYGGTQTPYGKGLDYLSRFEAKSEDALARSQLAGLKLIVLAVLWRGLLMVMDGLVYDGPGNGITRAFGGHSLGVPRLGSLVGREAAAPVPLAWASLYCELIWQTLRHAARGHEIIAILRLFGFNVFRNTYKPLLAQSLAEFWNRYFFYFKELLSEFFFLPVFARRFRNWPRLRLFAAVFAAAFIGNMYYHILKAEHLLVLGDALGVWQTFHSRLFYCLLLAIGLYVSMVREQARSGQPRAQGIARRVVRIAGVWTFFALIYVWNVQSEASFLPRSQFFASLFGLG